MKKILVVVDSINIEDSSGSKANVALINNLHQAGFEVLVCHYTLKKINLKNINTLAIKENKMSFMYFLSRLQRIISRNFKVNMAPFFERLFGFSFTFFNDTKSIQKAIEKITFQPDLVLTLSKGASFRSHYAVLKIPHLYDKWIAYVHDPFPFHFYPRPYNWVESSYRQKELFFKELSIKAKFSAFPSMLLKEWMSTYFWNFEKTGIIIPHQNQKYTVQNTVFPSYFDASKFNMLHAGNLMKQRSPEGLLNGFILFLQNNLEAKNDARLILIGSASDHDELLQKYKNNSEIYIHSSSKPFDEVYHLQSNASVNIILEAKGEISPFLPAKFPHCIEANKTILSLAPYYSETKRLLGKDYEYWSEIDDVERIAFLIEKLYQLWKKNPDNLHLNRVDLAAYVSSDHLKEIIDNLSTN